MNKRENNWIPVALILILLILWEVIVRWQQIPLYVLPAPSSVVTALGEEWKTLAAHGAVTVGEAFLGMGIALVVALFMGILMDMFPAVKKGIYPLLIVTQTVPMIVLAPILIIYMGFGMAPKILTVVLMCFFPIVVSFTDGMAQLEPGYVNLVRSYGAKGFEVYRLVKLPASIPSLLSGLKVAATYSISGAVVGEWIGSQEGLGYYLLRVKNNYMLDRVFACVLVIIFLSLCMNGLIKGYQYFFLSYLSRKD
ncbi:MAG: ABC transporter permease [Lachnospiraceae bacterium]